MAFDELWNQVKGLPDAAIQQVPDALSPSTKKRLIKRSPEDVGRIVAEAINDINRGSVETVDALVRKRL